MRKVLAGLVLTVMGMFGVVALAGQPVMAADNCHDWDGDGRAETSIICFKNGEQDGKDGEGIYYILAIAINVLTFGVGTAATIGILISGYQYIFARDNSAMILKAKNRIFQIVIGLVIYALFWAIANFLIPGGLITS